MIGPAPETQSEAEARPGAVRKPILLFFHSRTSGHCRRVEGFLAQVLQRGRNHSAFTLHRIDQDLRPDLFVKFGVEEPPVLIVVDGKQARARLEKPRGCVEIQTALAPWLSAGRRTKDGSEGSSRVERIHDRQSRKAYW